MTAVFDVDEATFSDKVEKRSHALPVVVDFWAEWCGPCKALTPALESAAQRREGKLELAEVDVDANPGLATRFRVQGIPSVKAFRDGSVAAEFTGAIPPAEVERFFDTLVPSEADELVSAGDEESLRRALELEPRHTAARRELARVLLRRGEIAAARELLAEISGDFVADGLLARADLQERGELEDAFAAWDEGDPARALELLQEALRDGRDYDGRDLVRRVMVSIFTDLGAGHPLAQEHRRRLASLLN